MYVNFSKPLGILFISITLDTLSYLVNIYPRIYVGLSEFSTVLTHSLHTHRHTIMAESRVNL